jgi:RNA polymerase sigma-70 factor (ECF subfamily)
MPRAIALQAEHLSPTQRAVFAWLQGTAPELAVVQAFHASFAKVKGATKHSAKRATAAAHRIARRVSKAIETPSGSGGFGTRKSYESLRRDAIAARTDTPFSDIFRGERCSKGAHTHRVSPSSHSSSQTAANASAHATTRDQRSDEQLVVAHRAGDSGALRVLIDRYKSELHGFLTRLVGNRTGADDVFQEAFLQVHLSADNFDEERRFKPWLYTIAANKGRDYLRRQKRRSAVSLDAPVGAQSDASLVDLLDGNDAAPASSLEASDEASIVKFVVDELPGHFREILLLAYFQKMSYAQISDSLAIPLGTVKSRLHAAVACFAESWRIACARRGIRVDAKPLPLRARKEEDE